MVHFGSQLATCNRCLERRPCGCFYFLAPIVVIHLCRECLALMAVAVGQAGARLASESLEAPR